MNIPLLSADHSFSYGGELCLAPP